MVHLIEDRARALVIGIDCADPALVSKWTGDGTLPNLARLSSRGVFGPLQSTPTFLSPEAWTGFQCGVNAGKHGIYEFQQRSPGGYGAYPVNSRDRQSRTIWSLLSEAGKRVAVTNIPLTFPAEELNGVQVSGFMCPSMDSEGFTHPPELARQIRERHGTYPLNPRWGTPDPDGDLREICDRMVHDLRRKAAVALDILGTERWDCFVHVFNEADWATHFLWHTHDTSHPQHPHDGFAPTEDLLLRVYKAIDEEIGSLVAEAGPDVDVIVLSDHGGGTNEKGNTHLCGFLESLGLLYRRRGVLAAVQSRAVEAISHIAASVPASLTKNVRNRGGGLGESLMGQFIYGEIDWNATRAYGPRLFGSGRVFLNLKNREPRGIVAAGSEADGLLELLTEDLTHSKDRADGGRAVKSVSRGSDMYFGPHADRAPDLIVQWREDRVLDGIIAPIAGEVSPEFDGKLETANGLTGCHKRQGVFMAAGPSISRSAQVDSASILDLAPTLLHLLGHAVPEEMDGRVLEEVLEADFRTAFPIAFCGTPMQLDGQATEYTAEEQELVEKRLSDLGYM